MVDCHRVIIEVPLVLNLSYGKKKGRKQSTCTILKNERCELEGRALFILGNNRLLWGIFLGLNILILFLMIDTDDP